MSVTLARPYKTYLKNSKPSQDQSLAVWILAVKLPNPDLNFAVDFEVTPVFSKEKGPKNAESFHSKIHPETCWDKFPSDFCRSLVLTNP